MKNYIKGTYIRNIFKADSGYIIGLFKVYETNDPDMRDFIEQDEKEEEVDLYHSKYKENIEN